MNGERVSVGMRAAYAQAKLAGRQPSFGFKRGVDDDTVARIIRARKRGRSYCAIAKRLDRSGITPPGGGVRWYPSTVARIYSGATKEAS